ncbi:MAG: hypothetical protein IT204_09660 [Fimbriimonadaceae bacterium]|nr:hypothetical protein [Fimbriimonadaceae bacterium]
MPSVGGLAPCEQLCLALVGPQDEPLLSVNLAPDGDPRARPNPPAPYGLRLTAAGLLLEQHGQRCLALPVAALAGRYAAGDRVARVADRYLLTLVQAWLSDLSFRWHPGDPPGLDEVAACGLLELLQGEVQQVVPDAAGGLRP